MSIPKNDNLPPPKVWWDSRLLMEHAQYWYKRYSSLSSAGYEWIDVYQESSMRLLAINDSEINNEWGFLRNMCRNVCSELDREIKRKSAVELISEIEDEDLKTKLLAALEHYTNLLDCPCKAVLNLRYFALSNASNQQALADEIQEKCQEEYSPKAMYTFKAACVQKLARLVQQDKDALL